MNYSSEQIIQAYKTKIIQLEQGFNATLKERLLNMKFMENSTQTYISDEQIQTNHSLQTHILSIKQEIQQTFKKVSNEKNNKYNDMLQQSKLINIQIENKVNQFQKENEQLKYNLNQSIKKYQNLKLEISIFENQIQKLKLNEANIVEHWQSDKKILTQKQHILINLQNKVKLLLQQQQIQKKNQIQINNIFNQEKLKCLQLSKDIQKIKLLNQTLTKQQQSFQKVQYIKLLNQRKQSLQQQKKFSEKYKLQISQLKKKLKQSNELYTQKLDKLNQESNIEMQKLKGEIISYKQQINRLKAFQVKIQNQLKQKTINNQEIISLKKNFKEIEAKNLQLKRQTQRLQQLIKIQKNQHQKQISQLKKVIKISNQKNQTDQMISHIYNQQLQKKLSDHQKLNKQLVIQNQKLKRQIASNLKLFDEQKSKLETLKLQNIKYLQQINKKQIIINKNQSAINQLKNNLYKKEIQIKQYLTKDTIGSQIKYLEQNKHLISLVKHLQMELEDIKRQKYQAIKDQTNPQITISSQDNIINVQKQAIKPIVSPVLNFQKHKSDLQKVQEYIQVEVPIKQEEVQVNIPSSIIMSQQDIRNDGFIQNDVQSNPTNTSRNNEFYFNKKLSNNNFQTNILQKSVLQEKAGETPIPINAIEDQIGPQAIYKQQDHQISHKLRIYSISEQKKMLNQQNNFLKNEIKKLSLYVGKIHMISGNWRQLRGQKDKSIQLNSCLLLSERLKTLIQNKQKIVDLQSNQNQNLKTIFEQLDKIINQTNSWINLFNTLSSISLHQQEKYKQKLPVESVHKRRNYRASKHASSNSNDRSIYSQGNTPKRQPQRDLDIIPFQCQGVDMRKEQNYCYPNIFEDNNSISSVKHSQDSQFIHSKSELVVNMFQSKKQEMQKQRQIQKRKKNQKVEKVFLKSLKSQKKQKKLIKQNNDHKKNYQKIKKQQKLIIYKMQQQFNHIMTKFMIPIQQSNNTSIKELISNNNISFKETDLKKKQQFRDKDKSFKSQESQLNQTNIKLFSKIKELQKVIDQKSLLYNQIQKNLKQQKKLKQKVNEQLNRFKKQNDYLKQVQIHFDKNFKSFMNKLTKIQEPIQQKKRLLERPILIEVGTDSINIQQSEISDPSAEILNIGKKLFQVVNQLPLSQDFDLCYPPTNKQQCNIIIDQLILFSKKYKQQRKTNQNIVKNIEEKYNQILGELIKKCKISKQVTHQLIKKYQQNYKGDLYQKLHEFTQQFFIKQEENIIIVNEQQEKNVQQNINKIHVNQAQQKLDKIKNENINFLNNDQSNKSLNFSVRSQDNGQFIDFKNSQIYCNLKSQKNQIEALKAQLQICKQKCSEYQQKLKKNKKENFIHKVQ